MVLKDPKKILKEYLGKDPQELQGDIITILCNAIREKEGSEACKWLLEEYIENSLYQARCAATVNELRENMKSIRKFRDSFENQEP